MVLTRSNILLIVLSAIFMAVGSYFMAWFTLFNKNVAQITSYKELTLPSKPVDIIEDVILAKTVDELDTPKYISNASHNPPLPDGALRVAIIIDDMGVNALASEKMLELPPEVTLSFLPYGKATQSLAARARENGHEIMIHLPMEPISHSAEPKNPGENALFTNFTTEQIIKTTIVNLKYLSAIAVGVNNHMGSKFTGWQEGMRVVLEVIATNKLLFVDSLTTGKSKVITAAEGLNIPLLTRDVFLDHYNSRGEIDKALIKLEKIVNSKGYAIAIGHPIRHTREAIAAWIPTLKEKNIHLVPITGIYAGE